MSPIKVRESSLGEEVGAMEVGVGGVGEDTECNMEDEGEGWWVFCWLEHV